MEPYILELMLNMQYPEIYLEIEQAKQTAQAEQPRQEETVKIRPFSRAARLLSALRLKTA